MIMQDKLEKERNDAKNNLEEYVYDMRDKLHGIFEKYISENVSTALEQPAALALYTDERPYHDPDQTKAFISSLCS